MNFFWVTWNSLTVTFITGLHKVKLKLNTNTSKEIPK